MRWLVTGGGGQLGHALVARLSAEPGERVVGRGHRELDVADAAAVEAALAGGVDVLVNAAAYTDVDGCESEGELARRVNGEAPGALAAACRARGVRFVHVSTDFVFDGEADAPYREEDPTAPLSAYGASKLEGEQAVAEADPQALVVRTAWVFGRGRNFIAAVCGRAREIAEGAREGPMQVVEDQVGSPTYAVDLAQGLVALVERGARGLYHLANAGVATRWELARAALDHAGFAEVAIERVRTADYPPLPARRPLYTPLDCSRAAAAGVRLRPWREAVSAYLDSADSPLGPPEGGPRGR